METHLSGWLVKTLIWGLMNGCSCDGGGGVLVMAAVVVVVVVVVRRVW